METIVQAMEVGLLFPRLKEIAPSKTTRDAIFAYFEELGIKYKKIYFSKKKNDYKLKLLSNYRDSILKIEDHDDSPLKGRYDYEKLFAIMKKHEMTRSEIINTLQCKEYDYKNIIPYLTWLYPIYETDDEKIGYLV